MSTGLVERTLEHDGESVVYEFEQFNTSLALKTLTRLTKLIGEPLAIALGEATPEAGGGKTAFGNRDISGETLGKAVHALVERMDEKEVIELLRLLAADKVLCGGGKIVFDEHYRGKIPLLFKVFQTALEVQFGNFIGAVSVKSRVNTPPEGIRAR